MAEFLDTSTGRGFLFGNVLALVMILSYVWVSTATSSPTDTSSVDVGIMEDKDKSTSLSSVLSTLVPVVTYAAFELACFFVLRPRYPKIYSPRTFMATIPRHDRTPAVKHGYFNWVKDFLVIPDAFALRHNSLDAYLYLRFFKMMIFMSFVGCCITWPILFPVNATGGSGLTQIEKLGIGNIADNNRYYAHAFVAMIFLGFVMLLITRERVFFVGLRQAYLTTRREATRLSSRVVLFLSVPDEMLDEERIRDIFGSVVKNVWITTDCSELEDLVEKRKDAAMRLEDAEIEATKKASKKRQGKLLASRGNVGSNGSAVDLEGLPEEQRPTHKTPPIIGKAVDSIKWTSEDVKKLSEKIDKMRQKKKDKFVPESAVFIEFSTQAEAQKASQHVHHHRSLMLSPRYAGVRPSELIWNALGMKATTRISRVWIMVVGTIVLTLLWAVPVAIVGTLTNIDKLTNKYASLGFIKNIPTPLIGLINGFLPAFALSWLTDLVPDIFRWFAESAGSPTKPDIELRTMNMYFFFQVIQVFFVTAISSSISAVAEQLAKHPGTAPLLLAQHIPDSAKIYISYFILKGTAIAAKQIVVFSPVFWYAVVDKYMNKTPRQMYTTYTTMSGLKWGTIYPKMTLLAVIAITYACIQPLVLGFATVGFYLLYLAQRYNIIYTKQTKIDTRGKSYAKAMGQFMTGVYLSELSLMGLFSLNSATGPLVLMTIFFLATAGYHYTTNKNLNPMEMNLPADLALGDDPEAAAPSESDRQGLVENSLSLGLQWNSSSSKNANPFWKFLRPDLYATSEALKPLLYGDGTDFDEAPEYTEKQLADAYVNPAMTSGTPKLWLVEDSAGVSERAVEENKEAGIPSTTEAAHFDQKGNVVWAWDDLERCPVFKKVVLY